MKQFILLMILLFASSAWGASSTDDFNRGDSGDLGASWDAGYTGFEAASISSNAVSATTTTNAIAESYNALTPTPAQYAQATISTLTGAGAISIGVAVRMANSPTDQMYVCRAQINDGGGLTTRLQRRNSGTNADLANESSTTWAAADVIRLEANGTNITCKRNGTTVLSATDSTFTTGKTGIYIFSPTAVADAKLDNFENGDLVTRTRRWVMMLD